MTGMAEYRVDDLARAAGTTVRNVRAYQDRGLLPPPQRVGRVGVYDDGHLARLRTIGELLGRGYSLANISELLEGWAQGQDLGELVGLEVAVTGPWSDEVPEHFSAEQLIGLFEDAPDADVGGMLDEAISLGVVEVDGDRFVVRSPRELRAAAELVAAGIPLAAVLAAGRELRGEIDRVAELFVTLVTTHLFDPLGDVVPPDQVPRLAAAVQRLRPLGQRVVDAELARAMERHAKAQLGDRLERVLPEAGDQPA
jgi:DNA-binding transcriptional MerR regulator